MSSCVSVCQIIFFGCILFAPLAFIGHSPPYYTHTNTRTGSVWSPEASRLSQVCTVRSAAQVIKPGAPMARLSRTAVRATFTLCVCVIAAGPVLNYRAGSTFFHFKHLAGTPICSSLNWHHFCLQLGGKRANLQPQHQDDTLVTHEQPCKKDAGCI